MNDKNEAKRAEKANTELLRDAIADIQLTALAIGWVEDLERVDATLAKISKEIEDYRSRLDGADLHDVEELAYTVANRARELFDGTTRLGRRP